MRSSLLAIALVACLIPAAALAQWSDNFDAYAPGGLIGQSPWDGWQGNPAADANVTAALSRSAPHSVEILPTSDVVNDMGALYSSGQYRLTGWCYVPGNATGSQYMIVTNTYVLPNTFNWSAQILFDGTAGVVEDDVTGAPGGGDPTLPLIRDRWVRCELLIDLDTDSQTFSYDGQVLYTDTWTNHVSANGSLTIAVIDLFSNGGDSIYWDDLELVDLGATAVEPSTWGQIKSRF